MANPSLVELLAAERNVVKTASIRKDLEALGKAADDLIRSDVLPRGVATELRRAVAKAEEQARKSLGEIATARVEAAKTAEAREDALANSEDEDE